MNIDQFNFFLPPQLISQSLQKPRGISRLLCFEQGQIQDKSFCDIIDILNPGDVLVFNDTKVIPSFFKIYKIDSLKVNASLNLVRKISDNNWQIMAKPASKLKIGSILSFDDTDEFKAIVTNKKKEENFTVIEFQGDDEKIFSKILELGSMPLPHYITRKERNEEDFEDYQTVYSKNYGAVAAPTAGLHFSKNLLENIVKKGINIQFLTLHVGLGTFLPIKTDNVDEHIMHTERFVLSSSVCDAVNKAKQDKKRVICVGTTTMRVLESSVVDERVKPKIGETNIFIKPGHNFQIADALITNFHLPKSTLAVLVSAFIGIDNFKKIYQHAIDKEYKFFSYGDACFFHKNF